MHARSLPALAVALLLAQAAPLAAEEVDLFGRKVQLFLPAGYCLLDESQAAEKYLVDRIVQANEGQNQLVAYFAPCNDLTAYRVGADEFLTEYGILFVPLGSGGFEPTPSGRAESLDGIAGAIPGVQAETLRGLEKKLEANPDGITIEGTEFLGVLERDENALYIGLLAQVNSSTAAGTAQSTTAAGVLAVTQLADVVLTVNLYRDYRSNADIEALLAELRPYLADLVAANP